MPLPECQYFSGGLPNMFVLMPHKGFSHTKGTPKKFMRSGLEGAVTRELCAECGTHITTLPPTAPGVVLKVGTFDDPTLFGSAKIAIYTVDKQTYHHIPDRMPAFERLPPR